MSGVLGVDRRMGARAGHVFHVASPGQTGRLQLVGHGLCSGRKHAALANELTIMLSDAGAHEVAEDLAVGLVLRVGALAADPGHIVVIAIVADAVVLGEEFALGG